MDRAAVLSEFPFYQYLKEDEKSLLEMSIKHSVYEAGDLIYSPASGCLGTLIVKSGILRTYLLSSDGREMTLYRSRRGDICVLSASCIIPAISFDVEMQTETYCEIYLLPITAYSKVAEKNIYVENFTNKMVIERFSDVIHAMEQLSFMTLRQRVASFLIDESAELATHEICMTQEELARSIGSAREAVSRILKKLSREGYIEVSRGVIHIMNKPGLYSILKTE